MVTELVSSMSLGVSIHSIYNTGDFSKFSFHLCYLDLKLERILKIGKIKIRIKEAERRQLGLESYTGKK